MSKLRTNYLTGLRYQLHRARYSGTCPKPQCGSSARRVRAEITITSQGMSTECPGCGYPLKVFPMKSRRDVYVASLYHW